ncbi:dienelactone hydrolase [Leptospira langatensis]|uniref:Dienelactone hydrolase n=1 Tax=Leptospira langatensis TaxID=2484983 RepID=A0A5F1ZZF9_9LEPT|nr:dienelactone hydrolase [Leptospira langatensis]TGJ98455.1 dienelactone hydrolase [Leptospira langatensis]TGL43369.1 dienelactone hydrolase [Leptospira langatensis]
MKRADLQITIRFQINRIQLSGDLFLPVDSKLLVVLVLDEKDEKFEQRFSLLNRKLNFAGIATLLLQDLLTAEEREIHANRSDDALLADRLVEITKYLRNRRDIKYHKFAYLGLSSAAERLFRAGFVLAQDVDSIVLIGNGLPHSKISLSAVPILNIIGGLDFYGIESNRSVLSKIQSPVKGIHYIPGSPSHFEDRGKWSQVTDAVLRWFKSPHSRKIEFPELEFL